MKLRLRVVPTAERHIRAAAQWWHENRRAAPDLFFQELANAFEVVTAQPGIAPLAPESQAPDIRRFHLSRIHYFLYYRVRDDRVEILALWHVSRGSSPDF